MAARPNRAERRRITRARRTAKFAIRAVKKIQAEGLQSSDRDQALAIALIEAKKAFRR